MNTQSFSWICMLNVSSIRKNGSDGRAKYISFIIKDKNTKEAPAILLEEIKSRTKQIGFTNFFLSFTAFPKPKNGGPCIGKHMLRISRNCNGPEIFQKSNPVKVFVKGYGHKQAEML